MATIEIMSLRLKLTSCLEKLIKFLRKISSSLCSKTNYFSFQTCGRKLRNNKIDANRWFSGHDLYFNRILIYAVRFFGECNQLSVVNHDFSLGISDFHYLCDEIFISVTILILTILFRQEKDCCFVLNCPFPLCYSSATVEPRAESLRSISNLVQLKHCIV